MVPERRHGEGKWAFQVLLYFCNTYQGINEMWQIFDHGWKTLGPEWTIEAVRSTGSKIQLGPYGNLSSVTVMLNIDIYVIQASTTRRRAH